MSRTRLALNATLKLTLTLALVMAVLPAVAGKGTTYGDAPSKGKSIKIADLLADPERYVGKTVKVEGRITDVCPKMGCWIDITQRDETIRFKVQDGVMEFETDTKGHDVVAEGVVARIELDHEQAVRWARHMAEERDEPFDPDSVTGPMTIYRIDGSGAVVR